MWDIALMGGATALNLFGKQYDYKAQAANIDAQIESHELALEDRISARNQRLTNDLQSMRVAQAARGVEGGSGVFTGIEKSAERDIRADKINTANVMRQLHMQKEMPGMAAGIGGLTSIASGGLDIYDRL